MSKKKMKIKNKEINKIYIFGVIIFILSLALFCLSFYIDSKLIVEKKIIPIKLNLTFESGIDLDNSSLNFGNIIYGSNVQRKIILKNNYGFDIQAEFFVVGNLRDFILFDKYVYLKSNETKEVSISTITFSDEEIKEYFGEMIVEIRKT